MHNRHLGLNFSNIVSTPATARRRRPSRPSGAALPAYALYGEPQQTGLPELLHIETIARRSRVHDWEIRPHRHETLFQILVIASGSVQAQLDTEPVRLKGPCAITVPAMAVHGFRFSPAIDGMVITVADRQVQGLLAADTGWRGAVAQLQAVGPVPAAVLQAADTLRDDYLRPGRWWASAIDTGLRRLLLELARAAPAAAASTDAAPTDRALQHVRRFQALVEQHYRRQPPLPELAARLGITPTQLNRVCRSVLDHPALGVLHARLLLEAQRELGYTGMSIKQVAIGLGFGDAGYFTRWFQRLTGQTPSGWRQAAAAAPIIGP
jgi:AraC family transcriptional regulator, transcriptional activator of pobA